MIAVDWGTTSLRAYRLDSSGTVVEQRNAAAGVLACQGNFEAVLSKMLHGWPDTNVLMAGMIGSRNGWHEVPYVSSPAGLHEIAGGMHEFAAASLPGRSLFIVPGVSHVGHDHHPEVMRGEETQVLGLATKLSAADTHVICLPGTHSKWVTLAQGRIVSVRTAMTGELYALLRHRSLSAALMAECRDDAPDIDDPDAFARGVLDSSGHGGLGHHLFAARTQGLFGLLAPEAAPSYLSGLLIGHELRGLIPAICPRVHLVGATNLLVRYQRALGVLGVAATGHAQDMCSRGLFGVAAVRADH
jgi:2-dehydro-3-deoxygalactonokinase